MLRVCVDTNVWISGLLFSGPPAKVVDLAIHRNFQLVISPAILDELGRNLTKKFEFPKYIASNLCYQIAEIADMYEPPGKLSIVKANKFDNLVLETAVVGEAEFLVTGDKRHLLPIKAYKGVHIVPPKTFLDLRKFETSAKKLQKKMKKRNGKRSDIIDIVDKLRK